MYNAFYNYWSALSFGGHLNNQLLCLYFILLFAFLHEIFKGMYTIRNHLSRFMRIYFLLYHLSLLQYCLSLCNVQTLSVKMISVRTGTEPTAASLRRSPYNSQLGLPYYIVSPLSLIPQKKAH